MFPEPGPVFKAGSPWEQAMTTREGESALAASETRL